MMNKARSAHPHNQPQAQAIKTPSYDNQSDAGTENNYYQIEDTPLSNPELELKKAGD